MVWSSFLRLNLLTSQIATIVHLHLQRERCKAQPCMTSQQWPTKHYLHNNTLCKSNHQARPWVHSSMKLHKSLKVTRGRSTILSILRISWGTASTSIHVMVESSHLPLPQVGSISHRKRGSGKRLLQSLMQP